MSSGSILNCLAASTFGSFASVVGKFALDSAYTSEIVNLFEAFVLRFVFINSVALFYAVQIALIGLMLFLNSIMLNFLVHSMKTFGTARATTIINGFSFCFSGVLGLLVFKEAVALQWWLGVAVILTGVAIMSTDLSASADASADGSESRTHKKDQ